MEKFHLLIVQKINNILEAENHWVSGLCPASVNRNNRKHIVLENGFVSLFR
jgi:hypothetical protein